MRAWLPLKALIDPSRPLTYGIVQAGEHVADGVPYIRPVDMDEHSGVTIANLRRTDPAIAATYRRSSLIAGDLVVSIGPSYGKTLVVPAELSGANLTQGTARVAPARGIDGGYLRWALRSHSAVAFWDAGSGGSTFRALNLGPLGQTPIPVHSFELQRAISDYLDRETAQIDAFIAKNEELVALLKERRDAVILRMVTSDPGRTQATRSTGIRWIGEIPTGWSVQRLRTVVVSARNGLWGDEPSGGEDDVRVVRVADFDRPAWRTHERDRTMRKLTRPERAGRTLAKGDLLLEKSGGTDRSPVGYVVQYDQEEPAVCSNFVARMELSEGMHPRYWCYVQAAMYQFRITSRSLKQSTGIQNLDQASYFNELVPVPPADIQSRIADRIDQACSELDTAVSAAQRAVALAKERRAALISAAVAGQIDLGVAA